MNGRRRVVTCNDAVHVREIGGTPETCRRVARRIDREGNVARGRRLAVVPANLGSEMESELPSVGRPRPRTRRIWRGNERRIVFGECDEQRESLDLSRKRVHGDERIARLEVGS